eukprot:6605097-Prymnesium_polylepis.1
MKLIVPPVRAVAPRTLRVHGQHGDDREHVDRKLEGECEDDGKPQRPKRKAWLVCGHLLGSLAEDIWFLCRGCTWGTGWRTGGRSNCLLFWLLDMQLLHEKQHQKRAEEEPARHGALVEDQRADAEVGACKDRHDPRAAEDADERCCSQERELRIARRRVSDRLDAVHACNGRQAVAATADEARPEEKGHADTTTHTTSKRVQQPAASAAKYGDTDAHSE